MAASVAAPVRRLQPAATAGRSSWSAGPLGAIASERTSDDKHLAQSSENRGKTLKTGHFKTKVPPGVQGHVVQPSQVLESVEETETLMYSS